MLRVFLIAMIAWTSAAQAAEYRVQPGDTLHLEVMEDPDMRRSVLVLPDGTVSLPLAGTMVAAGLTVPEIENMILDAIAPNYVTLPHLTVSVASLAKPKRQERARVNAPTRKVARAASVAPVITVFAMGELAKPGKLDVPAGTNILQFLAQAGGFTRFAASKRVILRRTDPKTGQQVAYRLNAKKMMSGASDSVVLISGDVIVVPERKLFE
ncbi:polysaccharide biosynthesis/export family protein [uncultured Litoreibacter sp.]|uniref:polysaccharide biosynthesis/export family protein n=1 Tax=uncultured Litoreibacter sp. TaxID=1392394 RepID=UPI0026326C1D|nr:polysaccharide biosynthesis/export family protein [uncultured Litoreibacter sp.]